MTNIVRHVYLDGQRVEVATASPALAPSARLIHTGGAAAKVSTEGTNATPSVTEMYLAEVYVPANATITGISIFNGDAVTGNRTLALYDAAGNFLRATATTAGSGADAYQRTDLSAPIALTAGTYYVAAQFNSTSARFNAHAFGDFGAGKLTGQTYGTLPSGLTMPATFTADLGPIASLY